MSEPRRYSNAQRGGFPASYEKIMEAMNKGAAAVNANAPVSSCPYRGDRTEQTRFLALMWHRAYRARQQDIATRPDTSTNALAHPQASPPSQKVAPVTSTPKRTPNPLPDEPTAGGSGTPP